MSSMDQTEPCDEALLRAISKGEEQAFEAFYDRHASFVYSLCRKMLRSEGDAQGVLSEVFWQIWRKAGHYNPNLLSPRTYLVMLTRSRALDHIRAASTRLRIEDDAARSLLPMWNDRAENQDPRQYASAVEDRVRLREALGNLSQVQKNALELAFFRGLTHVQIAEEMRMPLGTVKSHIRQGVMQLRELLGRTIEGSQPVREQKNALR